jgi:hypothetical protein
MSLFDDIRREDIRARLYSEPDFTYLNFSSRPGVQRIRQTVDDWFSRYPEAHRAEFRARFREADDYHHRSAFFELFLHELLLRLRCEVEIHPPIEGIPRRPDFRFTSAEGTCCYLEAVLATDETREETAARARKNQVYDTLNRLESPDYYVGMDLRGAPDTPPSGRNIRNFLEQQIALLQFDEISESFRVRGIPGLPHWRYEHDGWRIDFFPIPKSDQARGMRGARPIGLQLEGGRFLETRASIRDAVLDKAGRYGELDEPYIVAVNVYSDHMDRIDAMDALFGFEQFRFRIDAGPPQEPQFGRARNGAWVGPAGIQNTRVSGVLIFNRLTPSGLCWAEPCLYLNPWGAKSYEGPLNCMPRAQAKNAQEMEFIDGESLQSIFNIPEDWPGQ